jgi:UDP:flavonoid glycosyltransferase YjiC (YdhE family)
LSLASAYNPDPALPEFLNAGPPPVYIGFGSIVVDDPDAMTRLIFKAVKLAGVRALVSQGWGGLGAHEMGKPDEVFMLGNIPHDWLFKHVSAVIHHGGAGTTAAGVVAGRPTVVVPFFGDQPFWGSMIARAGAGPEPIPYKKLTAESLAEQIKMALAPETLVRAQELGKKMAAEEGANVGAKHFHEFLDPNMQCSIIPGRAAVWRLRKTNVLLSAKAAAILCMKQMFPEHDLKL